MQLGFYFDQTRCIGCYTCCVACKDWHDIPPGPVHWREVSCIEEGIFPDVFVAYLSTSCHHCETPACADVCPVDAIMKSEANGIVAVDPDVCIGPEGCGGACRDACPYDIPQYGEEEDARMQKCDLCSDRWSEGKKPICVESCPTRAMDAGPMEELTEKYGGANEAVGFTYSEDVSPCFVVKPKAK
jgi:anaerobic dimethyl sulfoxide reductase subunit B (iron-sulfur subunit)